MALCLLKHLKKTTERVFNNSVDSAYKHNLRKYYGKYIVVICISNDIYQYYNEELKLLNKHNSQPEQVLSEIPSFTNDNQAEVYTLAKEFVKGYISYETGTIIHNPTFSPRFKSRIEKE